ncbi:hypothetical protein KM043_009888 [Ampulex compressa]|nr:hypothetical protein KM043_009888 [Ampulex compressa]
MSRTQKKKGKFPRTSRNGELITRHRGERPKEGGRKIHSIRQELRCTPEGLWWVTKASFQSPPTRWGRRFSTVAEPKSPDEEQEEDCSSRDRRTTVGLEDDGQVGGVMPPLGRALMGLWASEAYSFHSASASRFPSILFHNTPGDVYVLQDGRKMRSRLHSDIGRFTVGGWKRAGWPGTPGQSLHGRASWDLRGRPDYFTHRRSAVFCGSNGDRGPTYVPYAKFDPVPRGPRLRNWMFGTHLKQKESRGLFVCRSWNRWVLLGAVHWRVLEDGRGRNLEVARLSDVTRAMNM